MEQNIVTINTGSTSKRYALFARGARVADCHMAQTAGGFSGSWKEGKVATEFAVNGESYAAGVLTFLSRLTEKNLFPVGGKPERVAVRVVAPGTFFTENRAVDEKYLRALSDAERIAPLHIAGVRKELELIRSAFSDVPVFGISDSAFHRSMPEKAAEYPLPEEFRRRIRRFGYHGIALRSVLRALAEAGSVPEKIIACHLGGGASVTAIKNGVSIDTSMGFSPLEGLPMTTRAGTLDTGALFELSRQSGLANDELETFLNTKCGMLGLSGVTADVKELIVRAKKGETGSLRALTHFVYAAQKQIGAYAAALGGIDMLVFSGAIGTGSDFVRENIVEGIGHFGIELDFAKNAGMDGTCLSLESSASKVRVAAVDADEMGEMARELEG